MESWYRYPSKNIDYVLQYLLAALYLIYESRNLWSVRPKYKNLNNCVVIVSFKEPEIMDSIQIEISFYLAHVIVSRA